MPALSDNALSQLNLWLQWLGVTLTALGVFVTAFGIFAGKELSRRQEASDAKKDAELQKARRDSETARSMVDELNKRQTPRSFTEVESAHFKTALNGIPRGEVAIKIRSGSPEALNYAQQIWNLMHGMGFRCGRMVAQSMGTPAPAGITLYVKDQTKPPPFAGPVQNALKSIGIEARGEIDPKIEDEGELVIMVGEKE